MHDAFACVETLWRSCGRRRSGDLRRAARRRSPGRPAPARRRPPARITRARSAPASKASSPRSTAARAAIRRAPSRVRRYEEAASRQQGELDRMAAQGRRQGCESTGFFLFGGGVPSQQCVDLNRQISRMRANLDRINVDLQRLQGGDIDRGEQRRSVMVALAQNNCGAAVPHRGARARRLLRSAVRPRRERASRPAISPIRLRRAEVSAPICVRTCDGYYFPISYATNASRFRRTRRPASACARPPR